MSELTHVHLHHNGSSRAPGENSAGNFRSMRDSEQLDVCFLCGTAAIEPYKIRRIRRTVIEILFDFNWAHFLHALLVAHIPS